MKKSKKTVLIMFFSVMFFIIIVLFAFVGRYGCTDKPKDYTVEEHVKMITEKYNERFKVEHWYRYEDGTRAKSFTVYPLYDQNDKLNMFLVEMEPYGFEFVFFKEENKIFKSSKNESMYRISLNTYGFDVYGRWNKYKINKETKEPEPFLDENDERVYFRKSPFYISNNIVSRKYIIKTKEGNYIFAIKDGDNFINLVSEERFCIKNNNEKAIYEGQATLYVGYVPKSFFDL